MTLEGNTFENGREPSDSGDVITRQDGGAIISLQSTVIFNGAISLLNNSARHGGAILAVENTIMTYGETTMANNATFTKLVNQYNLYTKILILDHELVMTGKPNQVNHCDK